MSLEKININDVGNGNKIDVRQVEKVIDSSISISGDNNEVVFGSGCILNRLHIVIEGDDNKVIVGEGARLTGKFIQKGTPGNRILIGAKTSAGGVNIICGEGTTVQLGSDCMLSFAIEIRSTDSHGIFDKTTGERVNTAQDIRIGDHVWVGAYAVLLGGSAVPDGCVIGIRSLVSSICDEADSIYGGVPARKLRQNIRWERPLLG
jgi:acetyltransferase-like isoleucine patch superfamily enzyme